MRERDFERYRGSSCKGVEHRTRSAQQNSQNGEKLTLDQDIHLISSDEDSIDLSLGAAAVNEWENDLDQILLDKERPTRAAALDHPKQTTGVLRPEVPYMDDKLKNVAISICYLYSGPPGRHNGVETLASKVNCRAEMIDLLVHKSRGDMLNVRNHD